MGKALNPWEMTENQNIVINSARAIGCQVVNIHASDLMKAAEEHKEHLVLGLIWQIVKVQLLSQISIKEVPQLVVLLAEGEDLAAMLKLPPEEVLLRWIRYHLKKEGCTREVNNMHSDLRDGEVYLRLLHSIGGDTCPADDALASDDTAARAEKVRAARLILLSRRACGGASVAVALLPLFFHPSARLPLCARRSSRTRARWRCPRSSSRATLRRATGG